MARSSSTRWFAALAALIVFFLAAWLLGAVLPVGDGERVALRVGLVALGLIAAAALAWYLRPQDVPLPAAAQREGDDALTAIDTARARLPRGTFDAKAIVLVAGSTGSCKTTLVTRAGLDPELLAGDAPSDGPPGATADANLWLVRDAVLAEPGGAVFADEERWRAFLRALRPPRLGAAIGRSEAPQRSIVVCVSCELLTAEASAQLDGLAGVTRQRLAAAGRELGMAVPVYVVFTKADRIPSFEAWAGPLTRDEIRPPLGAALPLVGTDARAAGSYAERLVPRIDAAFTSIAASLAKRRVDLLGREAVPERRLTAYELPRELGKLAPLASRFLVEICRPTQLGASPQLRGFYFVGARPIVVGDAPASTPSTPAAGGARATVAFARPNVAAAAPAASGGRRVPQWAFLERLFPDVVFADPAAAALAGGGTRVATLRRALLGTGIAAALAVAVGVTTSWIGNRSLAARTASAARAVAALPTVTAAPGTIALPSSAALGTLDALRGVLDTLRSYETGGVPLRLRWGLWRGGALFAEGRQIWLDGYRKQLHDVAWTALVDSLRALPDVPRPTDDYGRDYAALKGYLETTAEPARATPDFLAPVLLDAWRRGQAVDADLLAVARRQFAFYASELPRGNPWPQAADAALVNRVRTFLGGFAGAERIYQNMLTEGSATAKPARLADLAPQAAGVVNAPDVAGAFTAAGWKFMQDAFRNADKYFQGERWVVGDATAAQAQDKDRVVAEIRTRYRNDYVQQWRSYLNGVSVARGGSMKDAAQRLGTLGGAQSPLLAALSLAARNTAVDSGITAAFQPVHVVTNPAVLDKFVDEGNQPYVNALLALQGTIEQVANMPPATDTASAMQVAQAGQQALGKSADAKTAARQLAAKFNADSAAAQIGPTVATLLVAPIDAAEGSLRGVAATRPPTRRVVAGGGGGGGAAGAPVGGGAPNAAALAKVLGERGRTLCEQLAPMLAKFPFNPDASADATIEEVKAALAPNTGALWAFQQERLNGVLEKQGNKWVPVATSPVALSQQFVDFFNRAAAASSGLFPAGAETPRVVVRARTVPTDKAPEIILRQGTQEARFAKNSPPQEFVWPSTTGRQASLGFERKRALSRDARRTIATANGEWALFRLVAQATKSDGTHAEWNNADAGKIAFDFEYENGAPVLSRGWLGGMTCTPQVTR